MGWEKRRGKSYYYRKVWREGRVVSVYCGGGERGMQAAREDQQRRLAQQQVRDTPPPTQAPATQPRKSIKELIEMLRESTAELRARHEAKPSTTYRTRQK